MRPAGSELARKIVSNKALNKSKKWSDTHIRYRAVFIRLRTMQTLKGSKRNTSVEFQTTVYNGRKKCVAGLAATKHESTWYAVSTSWQATLAPKRLINWFFIIQSFHLHSTENSQTFVYCTFFIQSIYQKLSRRTKTNNDVCVVRCSELCIFFTVTVFV